MGTFMKMCCLKKIGHDCLLPGPPETYRQQPQVAGGLHVSCPPWPLDLQWIGRPLWPYVLKCRLHFLVSILPKNSTINKGSPFFITLYLLLSPPLFPVLPTVLLLSYSSLSLLLESVPLFLLLVDACCLFCLKFCKVFFFKPLSLTVKIWRFSL